MRPLIFKIFFPVRQCHLQSLIAGKKTDDQQVNNVAQAVIVNYNQY